MRLFVKKPSRLGWCLALVALAVAAAPLIAAPSGDVKTAEEELKKAINASDLDAADKAIVTLRGIGGTDAVKAILGLSAKVPAGAEGTYWRLVNGAANFKDEDGLKEVAKVILEGKPLSRDLMFALGNNHNPRVAEIIYAPVLEKGTDEFRLMAADNLCGIEHVEAVDVVIAVLKKEEKKKGEVHARLISGLKWLTGADCGSADSWEAWWKGGGRAAGLKGREKRETNTGTVVDDAGVRFSDVVGLEKISPERILVMVADCPKSKEKFGGQNPCNFDDMDKILKEMKIPHKVVTKEDFEAGKVTLDKAMAILLTCTQINDHCVCKTCKSGTDSAGNRMSHCTGCDKHENVKHKLSAAKAKMIRDWVERGGYLFSEDWGLADVSEDWTFLADKGTYRHGETSWSKFFKSGKMMKDRTVTCSPSRGRTSHPLLRGVFIDPSAQAGEAPGREGGEGGGTVSRDPGTDAGPKIERKWKIDDDSPYIEVVDKTNVVTLMESDQLAKEGNSAVAITLLPAGAKGEANASSGKPEKMQGGRVLHVLSHFGKQHEKKDEFALQNLLLNFLMEANRRFKKSA